MASTGASLTADHLVFRRCGGGILFRERVSARGGRLLQICGGGPRSWYGSGVPEPEARPSCIAAPVPVDNHDGCVQVAGIRDTQPASNPSGLGHCSRREAVEVHLGVVGDTGLVA